MQIKHVIMALKKKDPDKEVQYLVVGMDTGIVSMEMTSEIVDLEKLFKAFKKPKPTKADPE